MKLSEKKFIEVEFNDSLSMTKFYLMDDDNKLRALNFMLRRPGGLYKVQDILRQSEYRIDFKNLIKDKNMKIIYKNMKVKEEVNREKLLS